MSLRPIRRALLSVSDKTGLVDLANVLAAHGVTLISTGGTAKALRGGGLAVTEVSDVSGFPEIMDGRVKTLHPKIHGGLLALRNRPEHADAMRDHAIEGIDLLVCNLYPFEEAAARNAAFGETIENIDVGGPAMIRAAAKNHEWVTVVVDPQDYPALLGELASHQGATSLTFRRRLAQTAFGRTASYDAAIANWFDATLPGPEDADPPRRRVLAGTLRQAVRYGENPHQKGAFYATGEMRFGVATARQLQGRELSYNNINDTDAAYELVAEFDPNRQAACAIIKHANPCGVALGATLAEAYGKALACDRVSAFGGILAFNRRLDGETAEEIAKLFTEVIIAPDADADARRILSSRRNLRLLVAGGLPDPDSTGLTWRTVAGGFLVQTRDNARVTRANLKIVTKRQPTETEIADMLFAFTVGKHVKSNTIVYANGLRTAGIGAGQMSRVDSAQIAALKARDAAEAEGWKEPLTKGSAAASDAFFPFPDGLLAVAAAGATAVIQPGGSIRLRLRRGEMETMFKIGCARWMIFAMQAAEIVMVVAAGVAIAAGLTWLVIGEFGLSSGRAAPAGASAQGGAPGPTPAAGAKPRVAVVNYPLWYFTKRIAGDHFEIVFPIPRDVDPSFWKPDANGVRQYQQAGLILLNGADYEKWRLTSVLPLAAQVNTSASFADRYMTNGEVITHSHGKEGLHSHGVMDFNTWMDPRQAKLQAQAVRDELARLEPAAAKEFDANLRSLDKDLDEVDAALERASAPLGNAPLLASHPVYHYAARRYGWNLENVHWEPDEMPSAEEWQKLEKLYSDTSRQDHDLGGRPSAGGGDVCAKWASSRSPSTPARASPTKATT